MTAVDYLNLLIAALLLAGIYAAMAVGMTVIYGVMKIVNLAHAGFLMLGAYFSYVLFERFISAARNEPPDIDVDFEHERREEVIQYVYEKYGRDRAGLAATVICYRSRMAIREVGKVLGLSVDVVAALAGIVWGWSNDPIADTRVREAGLDPTDRILRLALDLAAEQALRAGQIVLRLREFVSRGEADVRVEDLRGLVEEAAALALAGCVLLAAITLVLPFVQGFLIVAQRDVNHQWTMAALGLWLGAIGIVRSLLFATGFALVLAGVYTASRRQT